MSGTNGMVGGLGRAVTTMIGILKSLAVALAQRSPTSLEKKPTFFEFCNRVQVVGTSCHPVFIIINIFSYLFNKKLSEFCSVFFLTLSDSIDFKCYSVRLLSPFKYMGICLATDFKKQLPSLTNLSNSRLKPDRFLYKFSAC